MWKNEIPIEDEQKGDDRILVVVRIVRGVPSLLTPVGNENLLKLVVIDEDSQIEDAMNLREAYLAQHNLTYLQEMTDTEMQDEIEG